LLTTVAVCLACLYLIGLRADRIHAGRVSAHERTVTEPDQETMKYVPRQGASLSGGSQTRAFNSLAPRVDHSSSPGSVTVTVPARYRGRTAKQWARQYRERTRQLQNAQRIVKTSASPYGTHWLERAFLCIHSKEGPWTIHNPPYDGGLQMDSSFQNSYGDWAIRAFGSAGNWPISVQLAVAIRAYYSGRGFHPWPNTAKACGLL